VTRLAVGCGLGLAAEAFVADAAVVVPIAGVLAEVFCVGLLASGRTSDAANLSLSFVDGSFLTFVPAACSSAAALRRFFVVVHCSVLGSLASRRVCRSCASCSAAARSFSKASSCLAVSLRTLALSDSSLRLILSRKSTSASSSGRNWFFSFVASSNASCLAAVDILG